MSTAIDNSAISMPPNMEHMESKPLSPSSVPDLDILPVPLSAEHIPVGQLVSTTNNKHNPGDSLGDRDFDDIGSRWYKDVVLMDSHTGRFTHSLGGVMYIPKPPSGTAVGTIEARDMRIRLLKDPASALFKVLQDPNTRDWIRSEAQKGDVGFVTAVREVSNASYKHASVVDRGAGNWEVVRLVGGEDAHGKRRDSGLDVETGSKKDVVGAVVRKVIIDGDNVGLAKDAMGAKFWS